jgi:hypothetical protein
LPEPLLVCGAGRGLGRLEVALAEGRAGRDVVRVRVSEGAESFRVLRALVPLPELETEVRDLAQIWRARGFGREVDGLLDGLQRFLGPPELEEDLRVHVPDVEHPRVFLEELLKRSRGPSGGVSGGEVAEPGPQVLRTS